MRKALIGFLVTAAAFAPLAPAAAQERGWNGSDRSERQQARADRQEQRAERQQRFVREAPQPAARPERFAAPQHQIDARERNLVRAEPRFEPRQIDQQRWQDRRGARSTQQDRYRGGAYRAPDRTQVQPQHWDGNRNGGHDRYRGGQWSGNRGSWGNHRDHDWNRGWRNDRRYDWQRYRDLNRSHYRIGRYYAPYHGWNYRRFSIGLFLEPLFYSSHYWISDPWYYRLPPAYPGTRWVRYYDDVLLVDMYTGEVIDVIYDFFW